MKKQLIILFLFLPFIIYAQGSIIYDDFNYFIFIGTKKNLSVTITYAIENEIITKEFECFKLKIQHTIINRIGTDVIKTNNFYSGFYLKIFSELPYYICWDRDYNLKTIMPDESKNFRDYCYTDELNYEFKKDRNQLVFYIYGDLELQILIKEIR